MPINAKGQKILHFKRVQDIADQYGVPCPHPLVGVFYPTNKTAKIPARVYGIYSLLYVNYTSPNWAYGRSSNKVLCGSVVAFAPGQYAEPSVPPMPDNPGIGLYFSPKIMYGTRLGSLVWTYRFFDYKFNYSIFLNDAERTKFMKILLQLKADLEAEGEDLNLIYITRMIEAALEVVVNAYKRCSDMYRHTTDDMFANFEDNLHHYLNNWNSHEGRIPQVSYFAKLEGLTHSHFGEAMKDLTCVNAHDFITRKMIDVSKEWLVQKVEGREVARRLGFSDAPHFTRFFVTAEGELPSVYKRNRLLELKKAREEYEDTPSLHERLKAATTADENIKIIL